MRSIRDLALRDDRFARIQIDGGAAFSLLRATLLSPLDRDPPSQGMRIAE